MKIQAWSAVIGMALLVPHAAAGGGCQCRFEVAGASGAPVAIRRATRMADAGSCDFAVRLRVGMSGAPEQCPDAHVTVRGMGVHAAPAGSGWDSGWQPIRMKAPGKHVKRRVLRARVHGKSAAVGKASLVLRCEPPPALPGCEDVLQESSYCFLGGGHQVRALGLDSGTVCRAGPDDSSAPLFSLASTSLAVWDGKAYTCVGNSVSGAFVVTPIDAGKPEALAGPCAAVATDGVTLFVLPDASFDSATAAFVQPTRRRPAPLAPATSRPSSQIVPVTQIRAYDLPEAIAAGVYRIAFDLSTVPADSPCAGIAIQTMAARDGILYASGCHPAHGGCTPEPSICVFDTRSGTTMPPVLLDGFEGSVAGLSTLAGARLAVLSGEQSALPPVGYFKTAAPAPQAGGASDQLHIFDAATGARLDSRAIGTTGARGLSCESRAE